MSGRLQGMGVCVLIDYLIHATILHQGKLTICTLNVDQAMKGSGEIRTRNLRC